MELKGIKYTAPMLDNSGYAQASRGNILALHKLGIPLTLNPISFENVRPGLGEADGIIKSLIGKRIDYNVNIIHSTPEFWSKHKEKGKLNIGYTIWETTKLHPSWPGYINENVDAVLVGCDWNVEVFRDSGVTKPLFNVPHGIGKNEFDGITPFDVQCVDKDTYVFYSIFQWTERKHPLAMIKAYWHAFQNKEDVALVLKTYRSDYSESEKEAIRTTLKRLKMVTPMYKYPPIYLISHMLSNEEILGLHARGDCYVSLDRGEGFGLSPFTAGACGNPIIVTGFGGSTEYAKRDNSYLVDYSLTPVFGMPWCMSLNSLVKTEYGYEKARNLKENIFVQNKNLNYKNINKVEFRPLTEEEEVYSIKCFSCPEEMELTGDHKLYVVEDGVPIKRKVEEINVGDYLFVPQPSTHTETPFLCDGLNGREALEDLFYLFGLYAAEGHIDKTSSYVSFAFNINEKETLGLKCKNIMSNVFGDKITHIYERDLSDRNGYEINFHGPEVVKTFAWHFETGSHKKQISDTLKYNELNYELLCGYWDGDGHIRKEGYKNIKAGTRRISPPCAAESPSLDLAMDIRDILLTREIVPSVRKSIRKDGRISYILSVSDKKFDALLGIEANRIESNFKIKLKSGFGVKVTKKELMEDYDGLICSISVETDEDENDGTGGSYILNGIASSNSPWYRGDQLWAEPNVKHGADLMHHVYTNQEEARGRGKLLQKYIHDNLSWEVIGKKIIDAVGSL